MNALLSQLDLRDLEDGVSLNDLDPDGDYTAKYICPFCGKEFEADGDTLEMCHYFKNYGCGCLPEAILDRAFEKFKPRETKTIRVRFVARTGYLDDEMSVRVNGALCGRVQTAYQPDLRTWFNKNETNLVATWKREESK